MQPYVRWRRITHKDTYKELTLVVIQTPNWLVEACSMSWMLSISSMGFKQNKRKDPNASYPTYVLSLSSRDEVQTSLQSFTENMRMH